MTESGRIGKGQSWRLQELQDGEDAVYEIRFLDQEAVVKMMLLQELVVSELPDPEIFWPHDQAYLEQLFRLPRSVIGVNVGNRLVAYSIIRLPGNAGDNLGRDIGLAGEQLQKVAHLQAMLVHSAFRGHALQRRMAEAHLGVIEDLGHEHVCCTVSPKNPHSLRNLLGCGFGIAGLGRKFQGWWRFIMYRNIHRPFRVDDAAGEEMRIPSSDIQGQIALLKRGFIGLDMALLPQGYEITYHKLAGLSGVSCRK